EKTFNTFGNRGASGIDGITSSAIGVAAVTGEQVTLIIGDLSFYHDLNGLLAAKHYHLPIRIILLNNNGGGIFSFLPQAKEATEFEALFGTPLDIDFEKVVMMYGGTFTTITTKQDLNSVLKDTNGKSGIHVIVIETDGIKNAQWHKYACEITGNGESLVLLHGFTGSSKTWEPFVHKWSSVFRVITIDLPGHGNSVTPDFPTMIDFCDELKILLEELQVSKCHLLGYS